MKFLLWSIFMLGLSLTGSSEIRYMKSKQDVMDVLESVKRDKAEVEVERNKQFKFLAELSDQLLLNITDKVVSAEKRIHELWENDSDERWLPLIHDIVDIRNSITNYNNVGKIQDQRIRNLIYAVLQCYDHDARLPEAIVFVEKVYASILGGRKEFELAQIPETDKEYSWEKLIEFLGISHKVMLKDDEQHMKEEIKAKWDVAFARVEKARDVITNDILPINTEDSVNQALNNLAEFYRQKHRLRRFIDPREDPDNARHIAAGDRKLDEILLPLPKKIDIHTEL